MPPRTDVDALLKKHLGKEAAGELLKKIDSMVKKGATAAAIEKAVRADLHAHIEKEIVSTVIAKIGPLVPIKVKPIQADVKAKIGPIVLSPKINTGVSVKVEPGVMVRRPK